MRDNTLSSSSALSPPSSPSSASSSSSSSPSVIPSDCRTTVCFLSLAHSLGAMKFSNLRAGI